jgi:hypothetical protein
MDPKNARAMKDLPNIKEELFKEFAEDLFK